MIQYGTVGEHTKNRDYSGKIETVGMFAKTSNSKHDWNPVKYLNVFGSQTKTVAILFLNILQKLNKPPFLGTLDMSGFHQKLINQLAYVLILMNFIMNSIHNFFLEIL